MCIVAFDWLLSDSERDDLCRSPCTIYGLVVQIVAVFAFLFQI